MEGHCSTGQRPQRPIVPMEGGRGEGESADRVGRRQRESGCHSSTSGNKMSYVKLSVILRLVISQYVLVLSPTRVSQVKEIKAQCFDKCLYESVRCTQSGNGDHSVRLDSPDLS